MNNSNNTVSKVIYPVGIVSGIAMIMLITYVSINHYFQTGEKDFFSWVSVVAVCIFGIWFLIRACRKELGWFQRSKRHERWDLRLLN